MHGLDASELRGAAFLLAQLAALAGTVWMFRRNRRAGGLELDAAVVLGTVVGAVGLVILLRLPRALRGEVLLLDGPIAMAYGALCGSACGAIWAARRGGLRVLDTLDALAPALGVMVIAGRMGCAVAGCCYGKPLSWGMSFPPDTPVHAVHVHRGLVPSTALESLPVHPTQIYEVLLGMAMVTAGILLPRSGVRGRTFAVVAALYAAGRFAVELARDDPRATSGGLSMSQWLSILIVAVLVASPLGRPDELTRASDSNG